MANVVYNSFKKHILNGGIDLDTDTIKIALVTDEYTPDQDNDEFFDDISGEVSGSGYTAGGKTLASASVTQDNTDDEGVFDAADVTWTSSTITAHGAVIYKDSGSAETSPLIAYIDFGEDKVSSNGDFTVQFNSEGILNLN